MSFNSKTGLDTILDKTLFQGYWNFISVYSLSHNITQTLKRNPGFQIFLFNLCEITPTQTTYPILASLGNFNEGDARLPRNSEHLEESV